MKRTGGWRTLIVAIGGAWMALVCAQTARTADPQWALDAFRRVVPATGIGPLILYLVWAVVLPAAALWLLWRTLICSMHRSIMAGGLLGAFLGVYLDYLQFAVPFAGDITNAPGLAAALAAYGDERLAKIWACSFLINVIVYAAAGTLPAGLIGLRRSNRFGRSEEIPVREPASAAMPARPIVLALSTLVLVFAAVCWQAGPGLDGVYAFLAQFDAAPGVRYDRGIVYARPAGAALRLDMARPDVGDGPLPGVVCIHGGGWHGGTRDEYVPLIVRLARRGYVAVTVDYRLAPEYRFPAQFEDVRSAVRWLRAGAGGGGVGVARIGAVGWSAGGHLACLLGTSGGEAAVLSTGDDAAASASAGGASLPSSGDRSAADRVQAVVSFSGITDLTADYWGEVSSGRGALMGVSFEEAPAAYRAASPIAHVDGDDPPHLFLHGEADPVVPLDEPRRLMEALKAVDVEANLRTFPTGGHRWWGAARRQAERAALEFLDAHLAAPAAQTAQPRP